MKKISFTIIIALLMSACSGGSGGGGGSAGTAPSTSGWTTYYTATASSLPTCSGDVIGRLYYVEDQANFQACKSTGWTVINVGNAVTATTHCFKSSGANSYEYYIADFTNGDKFVSCNVWGSLIASSNSIYWKASLNGAVSEACTAFYDIDAASSGFWSFTKVSGVRKATYTDTGSANNGMVITYTSSDCITEQ